MSGTAAALWVLGLSAVASAMIGLTRRSPMVAAVWLMITFGSVAGLAAVYAAHLVAVLELLVYAGAIMVLFVLVVFLVDLRREEVRAPTRWGPARALAVGAALAALWGWHVALRDFPVFPLPDVPPEFGSSQTIGRALFVTYGLPFEVVSLLLLVAIVGAVVLAHHRTPHGGGPGA